MKYRVNLIADAERDLLEIYRYVALNDSAERAGRLLDRLEEAIMKLGELPMRGHVPPELERIGVLEFREVSCKPYRVIYQIGQKDVFVHCVLDGRRDLQDILHERVLR